MVAAAIRTVFAQPDTEHVRSQLDTIAGMFGRRFPKVEAMLRGAPITSPPSPTFPSTTGRKCGQPIRKNV
jgi:putative transposase